MMRLALRGFYGLVVFCTALLLQACQSLPLATALSTSPSTPPSTPLPPGWSLAVLPGAQPGVELTVLKRAALTPPTRYRVVVVPGSGCTGWLPIANRYFAGLLHAELSVLHKPLVDLQAGPAADCSPEFVRSDALPAWRDHARAALRELVRRAPHSSMPVLLAGISEGAELLPALAPELPGLQGVVMVSHAGLDPRETAELQMLRQGQMPAWQALEKRQASDADETLIVQGRTLRYWRSFWPWSLTQPLLAGQWPLLRVWGDADAQIPPAAYEKFATLAAQRAAPFCDLRLAGADHGLQAPDQRDGLQVLWARLEQWARAPAAGLCASALR